MAAVALRYRHRRSNHWVSRLMTSTPSTLLDLLEHAPAEKIAIIIPEQQLKVTYGALRAQVRALAEQFAAARHPAAATASASRCRTACRSSSHFSPPRWRERRRRSTPATRKKNSASTLRTPTRASCILPPDGARRGAARGRRSRADRHDRHGRLRQRRACAAMPGGARSRRRTRRRRADAAHQRQHRPPEARAAGACATCRSRPATSHATTR